MAGVTDADRCPGCYGRTWRRMVLSYGSDFLADRPLVRHSAG